MQSLEVAKFFYSLSRLVNFSFKYNKELKIGMIMNYSIQYPLIMIDCTN